METNNFNKENVKNLDGTLEKEIDIIDSEGALELEAKIKALETKNQKEIDKYNEIRSELGLDTLDPKNEEDIIKKLPSSSSRFAKIKELGKNLLKAGAFAGIMLGANDAFSASNTGPVNNDKEKKEIKTEIGDFYIRLQEYKIIPETMSSLEFQEKAKDENWMKGIVEKYKEVRGIKSIPGGEVIKEIKYGLNTIEQKIYKKSLSKEERQKELEKIWKDVNRGKYKMGDTVFLSDGSSYLIKKYVPNTYKQSKPEQDLTYDENKFEFLEDYTNKD